MASEISPETIQILELHKQGATIEQIAQAMGKDPTVVGMLLRARVDAGRKLSLEERFGDLKQLAIDTLKDVAQFGDSDGARVAAAKILIDEFDGNNGHGGGAMNWNYEKMAESIVMAKQRVDAVRSKMLDEKAKLPVVVPPMSSVLVSDIEFEEVKSGAM